MSSAEKCPVCNGAALVNRVRPGGSVVEYNITCYGCKGRGWVEVAGKMAVPCGPMRPKDNKEKNHIVPQLKVLRGREDV